jgi:4-hydroxybenzoate polyprenyltransferase
MDQTSRQGKLFHILCTLCVFYVTFSAIHVSVCMTNSLTDIRLDKIHSMDVVVDVMLL